MDEPVDHRGGGHVVAENLAPRREWFVAGSHDCFSLPGWSRGGHRTSEFNGYHAPTRQTRHRPHRCAARVSGSVALHRPPQIFADESFVAEAIVRIGRDPTTAFVAEDSPASSTSGERDVAKAIARSAPAQSRERSWQTTKERVRLAQGAGLVRRPRMVSFRKRRIGIKCWIGGWLDPRRDRFAAIRAARRSPQTHRPALRAGDLRARNQRSAATGMQT